MAIVCTFYSVYTEFLFCTEVGHLDGVRQKEVTAHYTLFLPCYHASQNRVVVLGQFQIIPSAVLATQ